MDDDSDVPPETQIFCLVDGGALWSSSDAEDVSRASRAPPRRSAAEGAARALMALRPLVESVLRRARVPERDVPDVFQNVLVAVWPWWAERSAAPSSPADDTRPAYVVVVARRMAMQHHRRSGHRGEVPERDDLHVHAHAHAPSPPSPEDSLIEAEAEAERATEADLEALSEATPPARWRAFYAYAVEELPVARIAASEHAPRATIYTRIRLAREDLRAALMRLRAARRRR